MIPAPRVRPSPSPSWLPSFAKRPPVSTNEINSSSSCRFVKASKAPTWRTLSASPPNRVIHWSTACASASIAASAPTSLPRPVEKSAMPWTRYCATGTDASASSFVNEWLGTSSRARPVKRPRARSPRWRCSVPRRCWRHRSVCAPRFWRPRPTSRFPVPERAREPRPVFTGARATDSLGPRASRVERCGGPRGPWYSWPPVRWWAPRWLDRRRMMASRPRALP